MLQRVRRAKEQKALAAAVLASASIPFAIYRPLILDTHAAR